MNTNTTSSDTPKLSVMMVSTDLKAMGGISCLINIIIDNLKSTKISFISVGSKKELIQRRRNESTIESIARLLFVPLKAALLVLKKHIDLVHINPPFKGDAMLRDGLIILALRMVGFRRVLVYFHGWNAGFHALVLRYGLLRRIVVWLLNGTAHILVLAPRFKQDLIEIGVSAEKITVTRTMFDGRELKASQQAQTQKPSDRPYILFMSRFVREKGVFELVNAFANIAAEFPEFDLVMAGDGEENDALRARVTELGLTQRITFPGYVGGQAKWDLLLNCTIYTLPTYFPEGMPVALLEAMGAGKPLLTAKAGGIETVIHEPENGIVLDNVTTQTVEQGLRKLISDPAYCTTTAKRNETYAWNHLEGGIVTAEIEALYQKIALRQI